MHLRVTNVWAVHLLPGGRLVLCSLVDLERGGGVGAWVHGGNLCGGAQPHAAGPTAVRMV